MDVYKTLKHLYPDLKADKDYELKQEKAEVFISKWNLDKEQPTQEEIAAAWEEIKDISIPQPKTELEILQETVDQLVLDNLMRGL